MGPTRPSRAWLSAIELTLGPLVSPVRGIDREAGAYIDSERLPAQIASVRWIGRACLLRCRLQIQNISRIYKAGLVTALVLFAIGCGSDNNTNNATSNQIPSFNGTVFSISLSADGSKDVYVGGDFTTYNGAQANRIVRLNTDGTIDKAFVVASGFDASVRWIVPVAAQGGNVYVGGDFTTYNGVLKPHIVRLNANGTLDSTFTTGTGFDNTVHVIAPAGDGTGALYVGGAFSTYNGRPVNRLVRLSADGTVDQTFITGTGFDDTVFTIVPVGDGTGDVYVGGAFTLYKGIQAMRIVRLTPDGSVNFNFPTTTGFDNTVQNMALPDDRSGNLYVGGAFTNYKGIRAIGVARLNSNALLDLAFVTGTGFNKTVFTVAPAGDGTGKLYVGGAFTNYNGTEVSDLVRLNQNGTRDFSFATGAGFNDAVLKVVPVGDGSGDVYVGGQFTQYQGILRGRFVRLASTGALIR